MGTKCEFVKGKQRFNGDAMFVSGTTITANQQVVSSTTETALISETIYANTLKSTGMHFRVTIAGEISSTGTGDCTFTLRYGTTDILALATVSLANEDDKQFKLEFIGRVHTVGSSGKVVASARMDVEQGTPLLFTADTAAAGATVNTTADGSLNVTAHWDASSADNDVLATIGFIEYFN
jgi:hypothetical protein